MRKKFNIFAVNLKFGELEFCTVLWIHEFLVRIWVRIQIRGSVHLTKDPNPYSDPDPAIFAIDLQDANKKTN
jgi:hypothetical protein